MSNERQTIKKKHDSHLMENWTYTEFSASDSIAHIQNKYSLQFSI